MAVKVHNWLNRFYTNQQGMSLFELVVGLTLMGIVMMLALVIISLNANMISLSYNNTMNRASLSGTMSILRNDIQKLSPDSLIHAESNRLSFYSIDGDYVNYQKSQDKLYRNSDLLLKDLVDDPFQYLNDSLHVVESVEEDITYLRVTLKIEKEGQIIRASELFYLRN